MEKLRKVSRGKDNRSRKGTPLTGSIQDLNFDQLEETVFFFPPAPLEIFSSCSLNLRIFKNMVYFLRGGGNKNKGRYLRKFDGIYPGYRTI